MPDARDTPLFLWGEEIRRGRVADRTRRVRTMVTAAAAIAVTAVTASLVAPPRPLLVWNASASSPPGLYLVASPRRVRPGDMVLAWAPAAARRLGAERHYLPANVPLVKRVGAARGDRVCAIGEGVFVNGRLEALRRARDGAGRPMPWWTGCEVLGEGEVFLLARDAPASFDGRYFGTTGAADLVGEARLLWAR